MGSVFREWPTLLVQPRNQKENKRHLTEFDIRVEIRYIFVQANNYLIVSFSPAETFYNSTVTEFFKEAWSLGFFGILRDPSRFFRMINLAKICYQTPPGLSLLFMSPIQIDLINSGETLDRQWESSHSR